MGASFNEDYEFKLSISSALDAVNPIQFSTKINAKWVGAAIPDFSIVVNGGQEKVLASKNNTFEINLKNYNPADSNVVTTWSISPNITEQ